MAALSLLTPPLQVTKLDQEALRLDFSGEGRAYELSYTQIERQLLQQADGRWATVERERVSSEPAAARLLVAERGLICTPAGGARRTSYLSDTIWVVHTSREGARGGGDDEDVSVYRRTQAEALRPQNGEGVDGFDARRFGPSGRRVWMFDTGYSDKEEAVERGRSRMPWK